MRYSYKPSGVCAMQINFDIDGDVISNVEILKQFPSWWMDVPWPTSKASCSEIPADSSQPPVLTSYARQYVRHTKRPNKPILLKGKGPWKTRLFACS